MKPKPYLQISNLCPERISFCEFNKSLRVKSVIATVFYILFQPCFVPEMLWFYIKKLILNLFGRREFDFQPEKILGFMWMAYLTQQLLILQHFSIFTDPFPSFISIRSVWKSNPILYSWEKAKQANFPYYSWNVPSFNSHFHLGVSHIKISNFMF